MMFHFPSPKKQNWKLFGDPSLNPATTMVSMQWIVLATCFCDAFGFFPTINTAPWGYLAHNSVNKLNNKNNNNANLFFESNRWLVLLKMSTTSPDEEEEALKIIIAGAPASGKGTQCEIIREKFGVVHLSTGDMLRAAVVAGTDVGKLAKEYMDSGRLVPDEVIISVVKERLSQEDCQSRGWLLDGFPRTQAQANALAEAGVCADCFLFLKVPDELLIERVVGRRTDPETGKIYHMTFSPPQDADVLARLVQRSDDTEEKVKVRLEQFHANVSAVIGSYTDICIEIDGTKPPVEVSQIISEVLAQKSSKKATV